MEHVRSIAGCATRQQLPQAIDGGMVGIFDGDDASLTFDQADLTQGRADDDALITALDANPRVLRHMPRLLRHAGLLILALFPYVVAEVGQADFWAAGIEAYRRLVPQAGTMTEHQADSWAARLAHASHAGQLFGASNFYSYVASGYRQRPAVLQCVAPAVCGVLLRARGAPCEREAWTTGATGQTVGHILPIWGHFEPQHVAGDCRGSPPLQLGKNQDSDQTRQSHLGATSGASPASCPAGVPNLTYPALRNVSLPERRACAEARARSEALTRARRKASAQDLLQQERVQAIAVS